jgi:hypothetical protein
MAGMMARAGTDQQASVDDFFRESRFWRLTTRPTYCQSDVYLWGFVGASILAAPGKKEEGHIKNEQLEAVHPLPVGRDSRWTANHLLGLCSSGHR